MKFAHVLGKLVAEIVIVLALAGAIFGLVAGGLYTFGGHPPRGISCVTPDGPVHLKPHHWKRTGNAFTDGHAWIVLRAPNVCIADDAQ